jgi:hypothetical protein
LSLHPHLGAYDLAKLSALTPVEEFHFGIGKQAATSATTPLELRSCHAYLQRCRLADPGDFNATFGTGHLGSGCRRNLLLVLIDAFRLSPSYAVHSVRRFVIAESMPAKLSQRGRHNPFACRPLGSRCSNTVYLKFGEKVPARKWRCLPGT